jgi:hypothetical protein
LYVAFHLVFVGLIYCCVSMDPICTPDIVGLQRRARRVVRGALFTYDGRMHKRSNAGFEAVLYVQIKTTLIM